MRRRCDAQTLPGDHEWIALPRLIMRQMDYRYRCRRCDLMVYSPRDADEFIAINGGRFIGTWPNARLRDWPWQRRREPANA